jgi:hypothetical protein
LIVFATPAWSQIASEEQHIFSIKIFLSRNDIDAISIPESKNLVSPNTVSLSFKKSFAYKLNLDIDISPEKLNFTIDN